MLWLDPRLSWDPSMNGDIQMIYVDCIEVWLPDEVIVSSIQIREIDAGKKHECKIYANGTVEHDRTAILDTACMLDMRIFPFDYQACQVSYSSQVYRWAEIQLSAELYTKYDSNCMTSNFEFDVLNLTIVRTKCDKGNGREPFNTVD
ncbi:unnamed protein product, partial [Mesorhabditis belari]|uniref:Neurotransmitter-gated ion-channel ligand-binding domain-containing protein n=1 Tax=Mesorhabditis belari TaxID=2138241 RepID=A0AAF3F3F3_9BILA